MSGRPVTRQPNAFMFLCDQKTEAECLQKQIVGTTQDNAIWCLNIQIGDEIYLFNFNTGIVRGPYLAVSGVDCHEPTAWGGRFPVQVKICKIATTRQAHTRSANTPQILKKRRPSGALKEQAIDVFSWLQEVGCDVD